MEQLAACWPSLRSPTKLRVTRGTAYRWIRAGDLPAVRVGGTVRVLSKLLVDGLQRSSVRGQPS